MEKYIQILQHWKWDENAFKENKNVSIIMC